MAGLTGCGLGLTGLGSVEGDFADAGPARSEAGVTQEASALPDSGGTMVGATHDAGRDAPPVACTASLPTGWSPALFEHARTACPAGGNGSHDGVAGGSAGAGACSCSCTVGGPVGCETGTLQMASGNAASACTGASTSVAVSREFCAPLPTAMPMPAYMAVPTIPPSAACTALVVTDGAQLSKDAVRWCDLSGSGAESVCAGSAPTGFAACIVHTGSVSCPASSGFATRTLVSDDVALSCAPCSSCELTGKCGSATVAFFSDGNCNSAIIGINADGTCGPTGVANAMAGSVLYNAGVVSAGGCVGGGTSASVTPTGSTTTVCCR